MLFISLVTSSRRVVLDTDFSTLSKFVCNFGDSPSPHNAQVRTLYVVKDVFAVQVNIAE